MEKCCKLPKCMTPQEKINREKEGQTLTVADSQARMVNQYSILMKKKIITQKKNPKRMENGRLSDKRGNGKRPKKNLLIAETINSPSADKQKS